MVGESTAIRAGTVTMHISPRFRPFPRQSSDPLRFEFCRAHVIAACWRTDSTVLLFARSARAASALSATGWRIHEASSEMFSRASSPGDTSMSIHHHSTDPARTTGIVG